VISKQSLPILDRDIETSANAGFGETELLGIENLRSPISRGWPVSSGARVLRVGLMPYSRPWADIGANKSS
jgi:hypothetical protein